MREEMLVGRIGDGVMVETSADHPTVEVVTARSAFEHQPVGTGNHEVVHEYTEGFRPRTRA